MNNYRQPLSLMYKFYDRCLWSLNCLPDHAHYHISN